MDVLIVVDMQKAVFDTPRLNSKLVIANINQIAETIRSNGGHVIYVKHNGVSEEGLARHSDGWALLDSIDVQPVDHIIEKSICDSFYSTPLTSILTKLSPEKIIVTGCATDFCVDTTIRSAVSLDFNDFVVSDGHTTSDRPHLDANAIIEHHNWMWANLITPRNPVTLLSTDDLLAIINEKTAEKKV